MGIKSEFYRDQCTKIWNAYLLHARVTCQPLDKFHKYSGVVVLPPWDHVLVHAVWTRIRVVCYFRGDDEGSRIQPGLGNVSLS